MSTSDKPAAPESREAWEQQMTELIQLNERAKWMIHNLSYRVPRDRMGFYIEQRMALLVERLFYPERDEEDDDLTLYTSPEFIEMCNRIDERLPAIAAQKPEKVPDDISNILQEMNDLLLDLEDLCEEVKLPKEEWIDDVQRDCIAAVMENLKARFLTTVDDTTM